MRSRYATSGIGFSSRRNSSQPSPSCDSITLQLHSDELFPRVKITRRRTNEFREMFSFCFFFFFLRFAQGIRQKRDCPIYKKVKSRKGGEAKNFKEVLLDFQLSVRFPSNSPRKSLENSSSPFSPRMLVPLCTAKQEIAKRAERNPCKGLRQQEQPESSRKSRKGEI